MFHTFRSEYSLHHLMVFEGQYLLQGQDQGQTCHQDTKNKNVVELFSIHVPHTV